MRPAIIPDGIEARAARLHYPASDIIRKWRHVLAWAIAATLAMWTPPVAAQALNPNFWVTNGAVHAIVPDGNIIYISGDFTYVGPPNGSGAPLSAATAELAGPFPKVVGAINTVISDGSGGWFIGGGFGSVGGLVRSGLAHVLADGSVAAWNPNANASVHAIAMSGNTVYVGGQFTNIGGQSRNYIAALDATTGTATAWAPDADSTVFALAVSGGTVYAGGLFANIGGQPRNLIGALDATTGAATGWDPNAGGSYQPYVGVLVVSGSTIYAGGNFSSIGGQARNYIAALDATTGAATNWNPSANYDVYALAVVGSTVYAGGYFTNIGGQARSGIAALDATTGTATSWDPSAHGGVHPYIDALAVSGGTVYAGGEFTSIGGQARPFVAALDAAAGTATAWNPGVGGDVSAVAVDAGAVYVGGGFISIGGRQRNYIAALDAATGVATDWNPSPNSSVLALAVAGTTVYAGGYFTHVGGQGRNYIAALDSTTGIATAWNPSAGGGSSANLNVDALAVSGNTVYAGGEFISIGGQTRLEIAALDATSGAATSWNPGANNSVLVLATSGNKVYVGGVFTSIGGQARNEIAALDATSGNATDWNPSVSGGYPPSVYALVVGKSAVYVGGGFAGIGGRSRNYIAALDSTNGVATAWNPNPNGGVLALAQSGSTVYAGGGFSLIAGQQRAYLSALDATTGAASPWDPSANVTVRALAVSGGGTVYAGGDFTGMSGQTQYYLAAFNTAALDVPVTFEPRTLMLASPVPNPVRVRARINFTLPADAVVSLMVYDLAGRRIAALLDRTAEPAGEHQVEFDAHGCREGCYWYRLTAGGASLTRKMTVLK